MRQRDRQEARDARFGRVAELAAAGHGIREIVRETGLARNTVRRWVRRGSAPTWKKGRQPRIIDPFLPHLQRRLDEGATNATALWREIRAMGFPGRAVGARAAVAELRGTIAQPRPPSRPLWRRASPRQVTRALLSEDGAAKGRARRFLDALLEEAPAIRRAVEEARAFARLVRQRNADAFRPWLDGALEGPLAGFAEGLRRDHDAVAAALALPWSTGPVEGQIGRLKTIKRQMYGRAGLELLRARVLAA